MPKTRTTDEMRDYQRAYRARQAAQAAVVVPPAPVAEVPLADTAPRQTGNRRFVSGETIEHAVARPREVVDPRFPSGFHYLPGDGLIANMTQARRDAILARMAKSSRA